MSDLAVSQDSKLLGSLYQMVSERQFFPVAGRYYRNSDVAHLVGKGAVASDLYHLLEAAGTFELNTEEIQWCDSDGESRKLLVNRASKTAMWPMGTHYWVRDNVLIAARLLNLDYRHGVHDPQLFERGKQLLLSAITVLSSVRQLERFDAIIAHPTEGRDPHCWPHIFVDLEDNIEAAKEEGWMHKQDAWQIACYYLLDSLQKGYLKRDELTGKQWSLLEKVTPFLAAVDFSQCENGGSWEEIAAVRSSVIAWEVALLKKLQQTDFINDSRIDVLLQRGIDHLQDALPLECPGYVEADPRYRRADAALIYPLWLDIYDLFKPELADDLRRQTIEQVSTLLGEYGVKRYIGDSYQGLNYYSNRVAEQLREISQGPSGDSSGVESFIRRAELVPSGYEAQWTHFVWQLSCLHGKWFASSGDERYRQAQEQFFSLGLSLITGEGEYSLREGEERMEVFKLPAFRLPECYNSVEWGENIFMYPSLHTPLYWSVAECLAAFDQMMTTQAMITTRG